MKIPLIDLQQQIQFLKPALLTKIEQLLDSGLFIMGPEVVGLEERFCQMVGSKYAASCNSGTDALIFILEALGVGAGDEVVTTPFTFFATAESISRVGARPVFVDVRFDTFNLNVECVEHAITEKTKAIMPVHIFGQPVDMEPLLAIAAQYGLKVVEDACQAVGATYKFSDGTVRQAGSLGDAAAFSFYPTRNLGAYGDGGMVTTNDEQLASLVKALRNHGGGWSGKHAYEMLTGQNIVMAANGNNIDNTVDDIARYHNFFIGSNSRLDALQAAILAVKIDYLEQWNKARQRLSKRYTQLLTEHGLLTRLLPQAVPRHIKSACYLYIVQCQERAALSAHLKQYGIATGIYYPVPLHLQKAYQTGRYDLGHSRGDFPASEILSRRTMALPLFPEMTEQQQLYVIENIRDFYRQLGKL